MARTYPPPYERFIAKIKVNPDTGCWEWQGCDNGAGYGVFSANGRNQLTHRFSYELFVGPIPEGLELDHLCRVRHCANPDHLEAVTGIVNRRRGIGVIAVNAAKTHCIKGHVFDEENTYIWRNERQCRICKREHNRNYEKYRRNRPPKGPQNDS